MFITNDLNAKDGQKTVKEHIVSLMNFTDELNFLVGYFYFSGFKEMCESLKAKPDIKLKVLVGLQAEKFMGEIIGDL